MVVTARSHGRPSTSVTMTPDGRMSATSPSSRKMTWSVWARIAATSLARNDLAIADADDERHVLAGADEPVALAAVHDDDGVRALELAKRRPDGVGDVAVVGLLDEVGDRLGVGLGGQRVAARLEAVAQLAEVLDDPVVDDRDLAGAVLVRMGIEVVGPAVGRPARVGEADRGVGRPVGDRRLQVGELAGPLLDEEIAGVVDERDAGRVVAAVLEPPQAFDEDRARLPGTGVTNDAAHAVRTSARRPTATPGRGDSFGWAPRSV